MAAAMIEFPASPSELTEPAKGQIEGVVKKLRAAYFCRINPLVVSGRFDRSDLRGGAARRGRPVITELQRLDVPVDLIYTTTEGTSTGNVGKNLVDVQAMGWGKGWGGNAPCNNPLLPSGGDY